MHSKDFNQVVQDQFKLCTDLLLSKGVEYSTDDDKLHNFKKTATIRNTTVQDALGGFMAKHTTSIYDMIDKPHLDFSMDVWDEKLTDHINYLLLLRAVIVEQKGGLVNDSSS